MPFGKIAIMPRHRPQRSVRLVCPHGENLQHRLARVFGGTPSDAGLVPSGRDRLGRMHFRCRCCGYHVAL